jgi:hypothetical protein
MTAYRFSLLKCALFGHDWSRNWDSWVCNRVACRGLTRRGA